MPTFLVFLYENRDVIAAVAKAIEAGLSKDDLIKTIDRAIIDASDATVEKELGTP